MITGDYPNTARAIAESIGLMRPGHNVLTGAQLEQLSDEELREEVKKTDVYARVSPEHKLRIVNALQANGEVVAMTGDGGERCSCHQTGGYRGFDGNYRNRCGQGYSRYGAY